MYLLNILFLLFYTTPVHITGARVFVGILPLRNKVEISSTFLKMFKMVSD